MSIASAAVTDAAHEPEAPARESVAGRLGWRWTNRLRAVFGLPWERRLARAALAIPRIRDWERKLEKVSDGDLRELGLKLRGRARGGENLDRLLPEAFGAVCVVAKRRIGLRPFDVQLAAGYVLHQGALAELATGEGKTLVALLPTFLNALTGKGVHVTTVNDYLARRDAEWMGPVYESLGLSVGILQQQMGEQDRKRAYRSDITYGTASEFGFDFLRDRLKVAGNRGQEAPFWDAWLKKEAPATPADVMVQRPEHHFALVDEADNIFIDEARTPLIIANPTRPATPAEQVVYHWANQLAQKMSPAEHFLLDEKKQKIELTLAGRQLMRYSNPPVGPHSHAMDKLQEHVERALHAHYRFRRDQHYMIEKGKVVIIDEATGRRMPDRHWREGLHQAVESKEGVQVTVASDHAAQITFQSYFRLYKKLAGMTGTAAQNWWEILRVYKLWVVCVPTNRPVIREQWPDRVFPTEDAKFDAVVTEVQRLQALGRPVLIGTRSVERSEKLSRRLTEASVEHQVLNARHHEQEAKIVSQAGRKGKVTIATNMAGRGTDIKPPREVIEAGGLHVLGTERHEALRIDRQLLGRAGRQGDPGSAQFFLSLEDELLEGLGEDAQHHFEELGQRGGRRNWQGYHKYFVKGQKRLERRHRRNRVDLMVYEKRRQEILKDLGADPYVD
jgi:preprotein translocase subunit SecA